MSFHLNGGIFFLIFAIFWHCMCISRARQLYAKHVKKMSHPFKLWTLFIASYGNLSKSFEPIEILSFGFCPKCVTIINQIFDINLVTCYAAAAAYWQVICYGIVHFQFVRIVDGFTDPPKKITKQQRINTYDAYVNAYDIVDQLYQR